MLYDTSAFVGALVKQVSELSECYFEKAPDSAVPPYAVINGIHITPLENGESGDMVSFYIDVWADELSENAAEELEALCDRLRSGLQDERVGCDGVFFGHIGFDNYGEPLDKEFDIAHRRLGFSARIFYYQEEKSW